MTNDYFFEVRGYELDSFDHVNNAVYLNYLESARWDFFRKTKWIEYMKTHTLHPVVTETHIKYLRELKVFDQGIVKSRWSCDGNFIVAKQTVYKTDTHEKISKATVKMILVSHERIAYDLPDFVVDALNNEDETCV